LVLLDFVCPGIQEDATHPPDPFMPQNVWNLAMQVIFCLIILFYENIFLGA
jgi:hypothetical protein